MPFINYMTREINLKLVYYGPGLSGRTTNLQYIYSRLNPEQRGKLISLATETERSLFFDFSPATLAPFNGMRFRFHLYTVPGAVFYGTSHIQVLKGVDGIVFVADSQRERLEANLESMGNLLYNLETFQGKNLAEVPLVLQYNKRDLPNAMPVDEIDAVLRAPWGLEWPRLAAVANNGTAVFETLKELARQLVTSVRVQAP